MNTLINLNTRTSILALAACTLVAATALAMAGDKENVLAAGCDDYDSKPIELPRLLEKIETHLARCSGASPAV